MTDFTAERSNSDNGRVSSWYVADDDSDFMNMGTSRYSQMIPEMLLEFTVVRERAFSRGREITEVNEIIDISAILLWVIAFFSYRLLSNAILIEKRFKFDLLQ